ncbi:MAG: hypothetical protein M3450_09745 [Actinomycetota bacterium]|nr:hypothetical protein [Actinomycetota bacterium]
MPPLRRPGDAARKGKGKGKGKVERPYRDAKEPFLVEHVALGPPSPRYSGRTR